jgi:D-xylose transport system permease protein
VSEGSSKSESPAAVREAVGREFTMLFALLALGAFFALRAPAFLSPRNLSNLSVELATTATLALGMLLVIVTSHVDLAAGSGVGLFGGIAAVLVFEHGWPAGLALGAALVLAIMAYTAMGSVIVRERVPSFIITLAGLLVFKGLHWMVIHNTTIPVAVGGSKNLYSQLTMFYLPPALGLSLVVLVMAFVGWAKLAERRRRGELGLTTEPREISFSKVFVVGQVALLLVLLENQYRGIPLPVLVLGVTTLAATVLTKHTRFGRYLYAIGGNEEAARISGIAVNRVTVGAFAAMGCVVALTGFMQTAYSGASTTTVGSLMELDAIAACVIGGTSLRGGRGTVPGVLFGALIMACLLNGMTLMAVSPELKLVGRGLVLALAVWMDVKLGRRATSAAR